MGHGDVWDGDTGSQIQGCGGGECMQIIAKDKGKCDVSHFPREYVLARAIMVQRGNLRVLAKICEFHLSYF